MRSPDTRGDPGPERAPHGRHRPGRVVQPTEEAKADPRGSDLDADRQAWFTPTSTSARARSSSSEVGLHSTVISRSAESPGSLPENADRIGGEDPPEIARVPESSAYRRRRQDRLEPGRALRVLRAFRPCRGGSAARPSISRHTASAYPAWSISGATKLTKSQYGHLARHHGKCTYACPGERAAGGGRGPGAVEGAASWARSLGTVVEPNIAVVGTECYFFSSVHASGGAG